MSDDLRAFEYISLAMLLTLTENDIRSLDDLAGLDIEELLEFLGQHGLSDSGGWRHYHGSACTLV